MGVKIGDKIYDAENEPIMIILNESDKRNIENMHDDKYKYICYPDKLSNEEVRKFIDK